MALKKVLKTLDGLSDEVKKEYKAVGDEFHLDVDGDDSTAKIAHLEDKKRIAEEHREKAEKEARAAKDQLDEMRRGNLPKADVEALENSWKEKLDAEKTAREAAERTHKEEVASLTVGQEAQRIAAKLFVVPSVMVGEVRKRLTTEMVDGVRTVRVKDKAGKLSAATLDELEAELKATAEYAPILVGSKSSGGGAGGGGNGGGAGNGGGGGATSELSKMSEKERAEFAQRDPAGFRAAMGR